MNKGKHNPFIVSYFPENRMMVRLPCFNRATALSLGDSLWYQCREIWGKPSINLNRRGDNMRMMSKLKQALWHGAVRCVRACRKRLFGLGGVELMVDRYWSDERHRGVEGWVASEDGEPIENIQIRNGTRWIDAEQCVARPELPGGAGKGMTFQFAHEEPMNLRFRIKRKGHWTQHSVRRSPPDCAQQLLVPDGSALFNQFVREVNERHLHVLEIGSRIVSPGSISKRKLFSQAASFTGFDYYGDDNTDIVGDAHQLSQVLGDRKFDAIFSIAVFEHLAMPWVVAHEIGKVLRLGGVTYHGTVFSWPAHERPWDFWRMSDEGLKVLFSPPAGFEIMGAGMFDPVSLRFRDLRAGHGGFPHAAGYASSAVLARKVRDVEPHQFVWPADLTEHVGEDHHYPEPSQ